MDDLVAGDDLMRFDIGSRPDPFIKRPEILVALVEESLETVDHKIGLLKIVDQVLGAHDPFQVEGYPVR